MRPTRDVRESPARPGLIYKGIGHDPDVATEDPPDPVDLAVEGIAYVPFASLGVAAIAQSKTGLAPGFGAPVTVTLDSSPTVGNVLVLCAVVNDDDGPTLTIGNGTWVQAGSTVYSGNGTNWPNRMYYQVVTSSTSAATTVDSSGGATDTGTLKVAIIELSGVDALDQTASTTNSATTTATLTPTAAQLAIIISATANRNVGTNVLTPATGMTELAEFGASPYGINYRIIASTSGGYTVGSTGASANSSMIAAAFIDTGTSITWIEAPLSIDDDDATYEYAYDTGITEFWRMDLGDTYLVSSVTGRVAFETAGANDIIVQGANEADFSDALTVATIDVTATGSFTAQNISASWTPTTVYRYWQLVQTTEDDIRVYEVSLFLPTDVTSADIITDHGELTGLSDDDHSAYETVIEGGGPTTQDHATMGATETIDAANGNHHRGTLDANCTITVAPFDDGSIEVVIYQNGTGGWDITWSGVDFGDGDDQPDQTANSATVYSFLSDDGTVYGFKAGGGGSALTVENEGTPLATAADTLNFVGSPVDATGAGAEKTITIRSNEPVTYNDGSGPDLVWEGDDLVMEWVS